MRFNNRIMSLLHESCFAEEKYYVVENEFITKITRVLYVSKIIKFKA